MIRQARLTRVKSKGLQALAKVNLHRSESGAHRVFKEFGQSAPVKISRIDLPTKKRFPWIKCSDWLKYLVSTDRLDLVVGVQDFGEMKPLLQEFWARYYEIALQHEIFRKHRDGLVDLSRVVPLLHHGDEGRGYKRLQVMVGSTHGMLGGGSCVTDPSKVKPASSCKTDDPMKVNLVGNTWLTHFIHFLMPVADYKDCPEAFLAVIEALADDYKMLCNEGIKVGKHERLWACCLACTGDSPYLVKTGRFDRSFYHRPLKAKSKTPGVGVCHMCLAGVESLADRVEFEEFGARPSWLRTVEVAAPWTDPPPFLSLPRELDNPNGERFFVFDLFHNWHLGGGKYFISSSIVHIVNHLGTAGNIDARFAALDAEFKAFFKREGLTPHQKNLTKELFGLQKGQQVCPSGTWSKGDQTTVISLFLEDYCKKHVVVKTTDPMCLAIVPLVQSSFFPAFVFATKGCKLLIMHISMKGLAFH